MTLSPVECQPGRLHSLEMLSLQSKCFGGVKALAPSARAAPARAFTSRLPVVTVRAEAERLRLNNLSPTEGSRRLNKRKGRGYGQGQGGTCGFGNRGQKARSGTGTRAGFEGGQTPLYRRLPKLRGIAGGMSAGVPDYVVVNLKELEKYFEAGAEVTVDEVKAKFNLSGKEAKLPLKILGSGSLSKSLNITAAAFSESAKTAIEAAGGKAEVGGVKPKWTRGRHNFDVKKLAAEGKDYKEIKLAKRVANLQAKGRVNKSRLAKAGKK